MTHLVNPTPQHPPFEGSFWIWPQRFLELHNSFAQFRHDFELERVPRKAWLWITADQSYKLYVNGQYAARGPARGFQHRWPYDRVDVADLLQPGHNWLSIEAYNPGVSTFRYLHQAAAGLLVSAKWGKTKIHTGPDWRCRMDPIHETDTPRLSVQLDFQEHLDLRAGNRRWITSAKLPRQWEHAKESRRYGTMPWHSLEPRNLPMLTREQLDYQSTGIHLVAKISDNLLDANKQNEKSNPTNLFSILNWKRDNHTKSMASSASPKKSGWFSLACDAENQACATVLDLGRPGVGSLELQIQKAQEGQRLDVLFTEALDAKGMPLIVHQKSNHSQVAMAARLTLKAGNADTHLFHMIGHRYLVLVSYGPSTVRIKPTLRQTFYPMEIRGAFTCDHAQLNDIYRISVQTQRVCALDGYVDTPWREQAQWWGDARVQSQNTFHLCNDTRLFKRGIDQIATQEVPNGLTYGHAPTIAHGCVLPDFSLIWLITLWDLYYQTGDASAIKRYWPRVQRVLNYFQTQGLHKSGLLQYDPRYWLFMDWCDLPKDGCPTLLNLWYLYALDKLIELTRKAKMVAEAKQLTALRNRKVKAVDALLWDKKNNLFRDGLDLKARPIKTHAIHNQTLAILAGLHPQAHTDMMQKVLLPYLLEQKQEGPCPSSYWVTYVYEAATKMGHASEVVSHLHRHWSGMIPYEGTFETFDKPLGQSSCSHAWAAHPIYHLARTLGGVIQTSPGWKTIRFEPTTTNTLTNYAKVTVPTPHGLIRAQWRRTGRQVHAKLTLPKGIQADVRLPGGLKGVTKGKQKVTGSQSWHWCESA